MVIAKLVNNKVVDLIDEGEDILASSDKGLDIIRHSSAHLLAQAVKNIFPNAKKAIGPTTRDGFFYDFDCDEIKDEDLKKIEKEMKSLVKQRLDITREEISKKDALELFRGLNEDYKVEIIESIDEENVTIYRQGDFVDLCRGPHVPNTSYLRAFKLRNVSGAYWKNNKDKKMLRRVHGYAFDTKEALAKHLEFLKEVEKRDHRKLGKQLFLFMTNEASFGSTFWLPDGMILRRIVENISKEMHRERNYEEIKTPTIMSKTLWQTSGHWDNYRDNMYSTEFEGNSLLVKPMNCPGSVLVYKNINKSYKDLPIKLFELGNVFRRELSGTIHGLMRQREFTQDDAHIFLTEDMIEEEIIKVISFVDDILTKFGFEYKIELSTRPEKFIGSKEVWDRATASLKSALDKSKKEYEINEGDGSFYGPKIDYKVKDAIGREWQCSTIQLDFNLPERFDLEYVDANNETKRPIMIHRAIYGSVERFIGILIEHYEGKFPLWLSPVQASILTISEKSEAYAKDIYNKMKNRGLRVELDISSNRISQKIKKCSVRKIPIQIIIGEEEAKNRTLNVRFFGSENLDLSFEDLMTKIEK